MTQPSSRQEIYEGLTPIFHELFEDQGLVLRDDLTAKDVPLWDSLNHINLVIAVEQKFRVKFSTPEIARLGNLGQFVDLIAKKTAK
ncbi:MAG: acyl carrier protein [Elusimicrobia bacterium]|nr:acyl carrier protein [Elusimicrobiota bacterium]